MIRLAGILTGSAIAVAFLIVALGMPEFDAGRASTVPPSPASGKEQPLPEPEPVAAIEAAPQTNRETGGAALTPPPASDEPTVVAEEAIEEIVAPVERREATEQLVEQTTLEPQWYAFWSPFRSELAADGFVAQLQRTTGLDYRVVKLKPGVYEVAFAYSDDADIESKLTQISSATGLDLSGG